MSIGKRIVCLLLCMILLLLAAPSTIATDEPLSPLSDTTACRSASACTSDLTPR